MQLVVEAVKVTGEVASGVAGPKTRLTVHWGAAVIFTAVLSDLATPRLSVTVTVAVKLPAVPYIWLVEHPVPVAPSPKFQLQISGATPPEAVAIKVIVCPVLAGFGLAVMADT